MKIIDRLKDMAVIVAIIVLCCLIIRWGAHISVVGIDMYNDGTNVNDDKARILEAFGALLVVAPTFVVGAIIVNIVREAISFVKKVVVRNPR